MAYKQKYTWKEIRYFLFGELQKTKHIMTFGTIGSCNIEHDIDIIITKKPSSKLSDFYKEIHSLFNRLNEHVIKKYNKKSIKFTHFCHQEEILELGNYKKGDLALHVMAYISYSHLEKDWGDLANMKELIIKEYNPLIGDLRNLFSKEFSKPNKHDRISSTLHNRDRINSNYSEKLLLKSMNHLFRYMSKHTGNLIPIARNEKEARINFYKICDALEK